MTDFAALEYDRIQEWKLGSVSFQRWLGLEDTDDPFDSDVIAECADCGSPVRVFTSMSGHVGERCDKCGVLSGARDFAMTPALPTQGAFGDRTPPRSLSSPIIYGGKPRLTNQASPERAARRWDEFVNGPRSERMHRERRRAERQVWRERTGLFRVPPVRVFVPGIAVPYRPGATGNYKPHASKYDDIIVDVLRSPWPIEVAAPLDISRPVFRRRLHSLLAQDRRTSLGKWSVCQVEDDKFRVGLTGIWGTDDE